MITANTNFQTGSSVTVLVKAGMKEIAITEYLDPKDPLLEAGIDVMVEKAKVKAKEHLFPKK